MRMTRHDQTTRLCSYDDDDHDHNPDDEFHSLDFYLSVFFLDQNNPFSFFKICV